MAPRLNQIIAIEKGIKSQALRDLTDAHKTLQKTALLSGISRTYRSKDEEGEVFPPESTKVQVNVEEIIRETTDIMTKLFDITATKDWANNKARADVVVDGQTIVKDVPVTYLLFLEKQLTDLHTFIKKLPTLDAGESWEYDPSSDCFATEPLQTTKTKKVPRNHVKAEATEHHPAQVEVYYEDIVVGYWKTIKFSGALPAKRVNELLQRIQKLQHAVKFAREEANSIEVEEQKIGKRVFDFLFAP
ncbi:MAG TPA: hypothetical protein DCE42_18890 [Myxococcales bacterium]|nr:hypothetical protein [Deltaproteobacteria bacterium]HAA56841.1 hypothetical protein [Myxococcales bacterium]|tara:strand:+ start:21289 stop:22026 length:738 start_codon:yes stop_codon:yes gene_type:complete